MRKIKFLLTFAIFFLLNSLMITQVYAGKPKLYMNNYSVQVVTKDNTKLVQITAYFSLKGMKESSFKAVVCCDVRRDKSEIVRKIKADRTTDHVDYYEQSKRDYYNFSSKTYRVKSKNADYKLELLVPINQMNLFPGMNVCGVNFHLESSSGIKIYSIVNKKHKSPYQSVTLWGPKIKINAVDLKQNVTRNGKVGLEVTINYDAIGLLGENVVEQIYLFDDDGFNISATDKSYSLNGLVGSEKEEYMNRDKLTNTSIYFLPNSALNPSPDERKYHIAAIVYRQKNMDIKDIKGSSYFYYKKGNKHTTNSPEVVLTHKPKTDYEDDDSSSSFFKVAGIIVGLAAIAVDAMSNSDNSSKSSASSSTSSSSKSGSLNGHVWIDLGLPSGTCWATCNVGATSPYQYGNYYAWGECWPKSKADDYSEDNYRYYKEKNGYFVVTKYNNNDRRTKLNDATEDVACALWGGDCSWVMPTRAQFQELIDYCDWTWTTVNNINGYKIKSRKNGKEIFLAAGGEKSAYSSFDVLEGRSGYYMTSERDINSNVKFIYALVFDSGHHKIYNDERRSNGYLVRPVCKPNH
ncbi:MAG: hypothetical protein J6P65_01685 [Bacteroidales bacterium]|nr:hypothetical protein [Bacteroidales bacterium]